MNRPGVVPHATTEDQLTDLRRRTREVLADWAARTGRRGRSDAWVRSHDPEFSRSLGAAGLIGVAWPRDVGGGGLSFKARLAITEELLRAGAPINAHWFGDRQIGPAIYRTGTPRLQQEMLPGILAGEKTFCIGMSEPGAGSDLASVSTTAVRVRGGWELRGRKTWTTNAHRADHMYVLARTDPEARKHAGLSEFIIDLDHSGLTISPILDMSGEHHFNEVLLDGVFVPDHRVLGEINRGWPQVVEQLSFERGGPERVFSSYPLFAALRAAIRRGDAGLADDDGIAEEIGTLTARFATLRQMCWEITDELDRGGAPVRAAATLKFLGTQFEQEVVEVARRCGAFAGPLRTQYEEALLASPSFTIRGGALEVLLGIVAKSEEHR